MASRGGGGNGKGNLTGNWKDADSLRASRNSNMKAGRASVQSLCELSEFLFLEQHNRRTKQWERACVRPTAFYFRPLMGQFSPPKTKEHFRTSAQCDLLSSRLRKLPVMKPPASALNTVPGRQAIQGWGWGGGISPRRPGGWQIKCVSTSARAQSWR